MTDLRPSMKLPDASLNRTESSLSLFWDNSLAQCGRLLTTWRRDPSTMIQALVYPAVTLLMFRVVLGDSITTATGQPSIYGTVAMVTLVGAMSGGIVSALGLREERQTGLLSRFWTLPVHRASGLAGRIMAEIVRVSATTVLIVAAGFLLGFRFNQGASAAVALLLMPLLFTIGFATVITALATVSGDAPLVEIVGIGVSLLMFFNTGFVPVAAYPIWLQDVVQNQPMSCAIDTMKGLSLGGPVAEPLMKSLAWSIGLTVVFIGPTVRGYRYAAQKG